MHAFMSRVTRAGSHYFDDDTMRFFNSRVLEIASVSDDVVYFVTSERAPDAPRLYSVRRATFRREVDSSGTPRERVVVDTVGEFQAYETRTQAIAAMREAIAEAGYRVPRHILTDSQRNALTDVDRHGMAWIREVSRDAYGAHSRRVLETLVRYGWLTFTTFDDYPRLPRYVRA